MANEMNGKVVVVTGANGGIGRATAEQLARQGATVVMICRSRERGEAARQEIVTATGNGNVELQLCDLSLMSDVRKAAAEISKRHPKIDVLINNAGVFRPKRELTAEGFEVTFATNYLSHFLLTHLLLPQLEAAGKARVVNVATMTTGLSTDLNDLQFERRKYSIIGAVGQTKLGLIALARELGPKLQGTGVTVNALHPGVVKTEILEDVPWLMRTLFHLISGSAEKGAETPVFLASSPDVEGVTGALFAKKKQQKISGQAADPAFCSELYALSTKLLSLDGAALRKAS